MIEIYAEKNNKRFAFYTVGKLPFPASMSSCNALLIRKCLTAQGYDVYDEMPVHFIGMKTGTVRQHEAIIKTSGANFAYPMG